MAKAGEELLVLVQRTKEDKEGARQAIKRAQAEIEMKKKALNDIDRAMAFAEETENFVPLLVLQGHRFCAETSVLREVPKDWTPKSKPVAAPSKKK
jgi:hypothetical protein